jgi:fatty acid desaturase
MTIAIYVQYRYFERDFGSRRSQLVFVPLCIMKQTRNLGTAGRAEAVQLVRTASELTRHLAEPRPVLYWVDSLTSASVGWISLYLCGTLGWKWGFLFFPLAVLGFYRATLFIHEVVHFSGSRMRSFHFGWNALIGIPVLMPSFIYEIHLRHHAQSQYGTVEDAEYTPFGVLPPQHFLLFPPMSVTFPILGILRFLVLTPLSWLSPSLRNWLHRRASALSMRPEFQRLDPFKSPWWWLQELCAFLWAASVLIGVLNRWVPLRFVVLWIGVIAVGSVLNSTRTVVAHRYRSGNQPMTFLEQLADSVNHPEGFWPEIWAPVGLRYHALHHLLPFLPYHSLAEAHRILMVSLPSDSLYRVTNSPSFLQTLRTLWSASRESIRIPRAESERPLS